MVYGGGDETGGLKTSRVAGTAVVVVVVARLFELLGGEPVGLGAVVGRRGGLFVRARARRSCGSSGRSEGLPVGGARLSWWCGVVCV